MSELRPEDRALFVAARETFEPSAGDRDRITRSLALTLGAAAGVAASLPATSAAATATVGTVKGASLVAIKWLALLAIVGGAGATGISVYRAARTQAATTTGAAAAAPAVAPPLAPPLAPALAPTIEPSPVADPPDAPSPHASRPGAPGAASLPPGPPPAQPPQPPPRSADPMSVADEARILASASSALAAGDGARALVLLDEHARAFPRGALLEERLGERVLALCEVGEVGAARRAGASFLAQYPESPLARRVRSSCAGAGP
jgi:hypothetical protein